MVNDSLNTIVRNLLDIFPPLFKKTFKQGNFIKNSEITPVLFGILDLLYFENELSLTEISQRKAITSSNCSRAINKLTKLGYTTRRVDKTDRRKTLISLTDDGKSFVEKIHQKIETEIKKILSSLNDKELKVLKEASDDLYEILSKII